MSNATPGYCRTCETLAHHAARMPAVAAHHAKTCRVLSPRPAKGDPTTAGIYVAIGRDAEGREMMAELGACPSRQTAEMWAAGEGLANPRAVGPMSGAEMTAFRAAW